MSFPKYKDVFPFDKLEELDIQLLSLQKELFSLQLKKMGPNPVPAHRFTHLRRQIRHLKTKKASLVSIK